MSTSTENKLYFRLSLSTCCALLGLTFIKLDEVRAAGYLHLGDIKSGFRSPKIERELRASGSPGTYSTWGGGS